MSARVLLRCATIALCSTLGSGCADDPTQTRREFVPEMIDSIPYDSFAPNPNNPDGKTLRRPAEGSIPRGTTPLHFGPGPEEAARAGRELTSPLQPTPQLLARGDVLFHVYCTPCHGKTGEGDGPVVPKFPAPPSLKQEHATKLADGQIFHIMTFGQGVMPSHAFQVAPEDRWKIVLFVRSLQGKGG